MNEPRTTPRLFVSRVIGGEEENICPDCYEASGELADERNEIFEEGDEFLVPIRCTECGASIAVTVCDDEDELNFDL